MKKSFLFFLVFPLFLSGCRVPFTEKEIYIPFLEKSPQTVINLAKARLMNLDNYRYQSVLKISAQIELSESAFQRTLALGNLTGTRESRVLGLKMENSSTSSFSEQEELEDSFQAPSAQGQGGGFNIGNIIKGNKINPSIQIISHGEIKRSDNEAKSNLKIDFGKESFSFDVENKKIGTSTYFKVVKAPAMIASFLSEYLDQWLLFNESGMEKIQAAMSESKDILGTSVDISKEKRDKSALIGERIVAKIKGGDLFAFNRAFEEELVESEKCFHYDFSINQGELSMLTDDVSRAVQEEMGSTSTKDAVEIFAKMFKDLKIEAWISQKDYALKKIRFNNSFSLSEIFKQATSDRTNTSQGNIVFDFEISYFDIGQVTAIVEPENTLSFSELAENKIFNPLNSARMNARDAKRVADIKQIQTALEMYFNDANRYPAKLDFEGKILDDEEVKKFKTYVWKLPSNPKPNDGICPIDYEYSYLSRSGGQSYELSYCLGEKTGIIQSGINIADPSGISKNKTESFDLDESPSGLDGEELDSDGDGLSDKKEVELYYTDPKKQDTDGDGYHDGAEVKSGYNPNGPGKL